MPFRHNHVNGSHIMIGVAIVDYIPLIHRIEALIDNNEIFTILLIKLIAGQYGWSLFPAIIAANL